MLLSPHFRTVVLTAILQLESLAKFQPLSIEFSLSEKKKKGVVLGLLWFSGSQQID